MKIWSPLLATALILTVSRVTIAQSFDNDFGMEITDDGNVVRYVVKRKRTRSTLPAFLVYY